MFEARKEVDLLEEEKLKKTLAKAEISLLLDSYDDIFSDFDPRHFSERALSDDFLLEAKKASLSKEEDALELHFLIPKSIRKVEQETIIKRRLREHFTKHYRMKNEEITYIKKEGWSFIFLGIVLMLLAILIYSDFFIISKLLKNVIIVLTEPAGWFLFWIGGERLVYKKKELTPEYNFYRKMSVAYISFSSY